MWSIWLLVCCRSVARMIWHQWRVNRSCKNLIIIITVAVFPRHLLSTVLPPITITISSLESLSWTALNFSFGSRISVGEYHQLKSFWMEVSQLVSFPNWLPINEIVQNKCYRYDIFVPFPSQWFVVWYTYPSLAAAGGHNIVILFFFRQCLLFTFIGSVRIESRNSRITI